MSEKPFCPLIEDGCKEDQCAWFIPIDDACGVTSVARNLDSLQKLGIRIFTTKESPIDILE